MGLIQAGNPVPLQVQLPVEDGSQFIRATVVDSSNNPVAGSPFNLTYFAKGNYNNSSLLMPNIPWIKAIYEVFSDSGYTTLSTTYGELSDVFYLDVVGGGGGSMAQTARLTGFIGGTEEPSPPSCDPCSKPFDIIQGADVLFNVLFFNKDTNLPFDLSSASSISAQFINTDGSFLTKTLSGGVTILSPSVLGQIQIAITASQTALMQYGRVSMQITLVVSGSTYIVQFPYALNVLQSVFN